MQISENKLKELLGKVDIERIDSACPDNQDECPVHKKCDRCWMEYLKSPIWE